ncbi:hypothetical protein [Mycolicibacterium sp. J2]|uniref:hypothetical protein n=1 Tax=Mycolicibacterium sp. J2 TaxID=2993511 RepID=UPI00224A93A7|nr:hypothetical protein [Mycolicibacterium sp. J2]MCX2714163.1 hypothetical protein [Mycolicibacterium sp. J2]
MNRLYTVPLAVLAWFGATAVGAADPGDPVVALGKCYDPGGSVVQRPATFAYNCDNTGVLQDMVWSTWGADGARGTGTDSSVQCQPNCAQGTRLVNPVVVHAWNPQPAKDAACPPDARYFSDLTIAYPQGVPPWITPGTQWSPGTDFVTVDGAPAVHFSGLGPFCS